MPPAGSARLAPAVLGVLLLPLASPAAFDPPVERKVVPTPRLAGDQFGISVAVEGTLDPPRLVAGAFRNDEVSVDAGKAVVFERSGAVWSQIDELFAPDGDGADRFGRAVAIDGDTIAVGAPDARKGAATPTAGAVYVFERTEGAGYAFSQKLVASDGANGDDFGTALALQGDTLVVGALEKDGQLGAAYVFAREGLGVWNEQERLSDPEGEAGDLFGVAVDVDGDRVAVGASRDVVTTPSGDLQKGSVLLFTRVGDGWEFEEKVFSPGAATGIDYGQSVALDDGELAVGAPLDIPPFFPGQTPRATGTVYRYDADAPDIVATQIRVYPSDRSASAGPRRFGHALGLDGAILAVGAYAHLAAGSETGALYLFDLDDGLLNESLRIFAEDAERGDVFGFAVSVSGDEVAVGADRADIDPGLDDNAGAAYHYGLPEPSGAALLLVVGAALSALRRRRAGSGARALQTDPVEPGA